MCVQLLRLLTDPRHRIRRMNGCRWCARCVRTYVPGRQSESAKASGLVRKCKSRACVKRITRACELSLFLCFPLLSQRQSHCVSPSRVGKFHKFTVNYPRVRMSTCKADYVKVKLWGLTGKDSSWQKLVFVLDICFRTGNEQIWIVTCDNSISIQYVKAKYHTLTRPSFVSLVSIYTRE